MYSISFVNNCLPLDLAAILKVNLIFICKKIRVKNALIDVIELNFLVFKSESSDLCKNTIACLDSQIKITVR